MLKQLAAGLYESLVTDRLGGELARLPAELAAELSDLDPGDAHEYLARHVYEQVREALRHVDASDEDRLPTQIAACNLLIESTQSLLTKAPATGETVREPGEMLQQVRSTLFGAVPVLTPVVPLSTSALITNDGEHVSIAEALKREIASADSIDLICAFVNYTGVRILEEPIREVCRRGPMRLVTTTYMGATQRRALDALAGWGVQVKVAYERPPANTKLHAKAWLFRRKTGFHTALVGSSNLSYSALMDGLEWNVRLSSVETPHVLKHFESTFERYWTDDLFESYDPDRDSGRLDAALQAPGRSPDLAFVAVDIHPRPHQVDILEALEAERELHGRSQNLVVAATGTGKTVVAALDYRRLRNAMGTASLLFVAHRKEILQQSLQTFRTVLRDGSFGSLWVDGQRPADGRYVFASIQSLSQFDLGLMPREQFDVVIVDEFHRAEAATYQALLKHLAPKQLLGLTATPERTDGTNVAAFFDGRVAYEMRLWDALDEGILCPFQYFGVADNTDLRRIEWRSGKYDPAALEALYVDQGVARAALIAEKVDSIVDDRTAMHALGYCATVRHAQFMSEQFNKIGIASQYVTGDTASQERAEALTKLRRGELNVIFAVDVFNEGVDLPEVDTVLFLRPTESATIYLQQLGRGLRLCEGKRCLTAIDFVGHHDHRFRFDLRLRAMTGLSRRAIEEQVAGGFVSLPAGCHIELDRVARDRVLENLKGSLPSRTPFLRAELQSLACGRADYPLSTYLAETRVEPGEFYTGPRYYTMLKRLAGLIIDEGTETESRLGKGLARLLEVSDLERCQFYSDMLTGKCPPALDRLSVRQQRLLYMLGCALVSDTKQATVVESLQQIWSEPHITDEARQLLEEMLTRTRTKTLTIERDGMDDVPIQTHGVYSQDAVVAALGIENPASMRQGVYYSKDHRCDAFFVTLRKTEKDYSPTTRYNDYLISPTELHWESQSGTPEGSEVGQRYQRNSPEQTVLLFVREARQSDRRTSPYLCLGPATYLSHEGERPMRIRWRLESPVPASRYMALKNAAG